MFQGSSESYRQVQYNKSYFPFFTTPSHTILTVTSPLLTLYLASSAQLCFLIIVFLPLFFRSLSLSPAISFSIPNFFLSS